MSFAPTADVIDRFNRAFVERDRDLLTDVVGEDCVMESVQPAPTGERVVGRQACLDWWGALVDDRTSRFEPQEVIVAGDRATIQWHYHYGPGPSDWVSGVNVMRVRDGQIVEALGYSKTAGEVPLATDN
ncbi:nuclear transport factor 2 family protein [Nonomuraea sp. WAC 01424]|uniref:nuclear transport factor 2 family protein n=1 Tax=Nonomuraea sp. WAC 01424 TaxID=2203200 RepID=UPI000F7A3873|nr:nuclear transport factor 2 family protein [Nonomuraea sp. WAC 01424]RSN09557.1 nuclear transport factor 2 family protein [Nonomuraea sp. WAC 01424]